jgi:hypothetical protein
MMSMYLQHIYILRDIKYKRRKDVLKVKKNRHRMFGFLHLQQYSAGSLGECLVPREIHYFM